MGSQKAKKKHRRGLWSPDEDERLRNYILKYGHGCWSSVPINAGLQRNGKSCRLRWINYLRPGLKRGAFSMAEEDTILTLHTILGNKWSQIAQHLPGRSDNEIKNYWHSYLKKRVAKMEVGAVNSNCTESSIPLFNHIKPSQNEAHQNMSLPKVLFAEWLSLDQGFAYSSDFNKTSDLGDGALFDGLLHNHTYVDDNMAFKLDFQTPIDYFPGEFNMHTF